MKAIVRDTYGSPDVLRLEEIDRPTPGDGEVLLRMRASSLNRGDRYGLQGTPMPMRLMLGLLGPKQRGLGMDFAGDVEELGAGVTDVQVGDAVYGSVDFGETWAEYACVPAELAVPKPVDLPYAQAAAIPGSGFTALQGLRDQGKVGDGQRVLINGATGAVGTLAVQMAKALGAAEVTAVCGERNVELVRSLGADHVIPYETEDFLACGRTFDVMYDVVGNRPLRACCALLDPAGTYLPVGAPEGGRWFGPLGKLISVQLGAPFVKPRVASFTGTPNRPDVLTMTEMIEAGQLRAVIDREFPLADTADALRYMVEGRPPSKVVITI